MTPEPQRAEKQATADSLAASPSEAAFSEERRAVLALLALDEEAEALTGRMDVEIGAVFSSLLALEDGDVLRILGLVMAETLSAGTGLVDTLGSLLAVDMGAVWEADDALLSLVRDREVLHSMLEHIAGKAVADAHAASPAKTLRSIIRQCATGEGRTKVEGWVPRFMAFPATGYTARGGIPQSA